MELYAVIQSSILEGGETPVEEPQTREVADLICKSFNTQAEPGTFYYVSKQVSL